jgi:hypothetical protein
VPYLQIDHDGDVDLVALAPALAAAYARIMETDEARISVAARRAEVVRCFPEGPQTVTVVTCEIRTGRPPERISLLAGEIASLVARSLEITPDDVVVYFTQHPGFEIFRDGAPSADWIPEP